MPETRKLTLADLRAIISDGTELAKGAKVHDDGGLAHLSRFEHKLYADAAGSGASPYKVQVLFEDKGVRGRCSCMAARSRPFCKHSAALLVAWAHVPESFAEAAAPPPGAPGDAGKKKTVKAGKVDVKDLMGRGIEQVATLVRELTVAGVASLAADRAGQVRDLGESLREAKLRRVSARTIELSDVLGKAASRAGAFDAGAYAELVGDLLLTVRKLEKHIAGEPLADEHVEELIGKVWTKKDRKPVAGLTLVEYAFLERTTADAFTIRESRFVDLESGEHFAEKQILPGFLVKRTEPKKSWAGRVLGGASGSIYPTFAPRRLDLDVIGSELALDQAGLGRLVGKALPDVAAALAALQERRRDVFAPDTLPVTLRIDALFADGDRLQAVDAAGAALFLPEDRDAAEALARVLREGKLEAVLGDVALDGALPTLFPLAAVVRGARGALELASLGIDAAAILESKKLRARAAAAEGRGAAAVGPSRWVDLARRVGASGAAVALGELREEMAQGLATGLSSVTARFAEPLASRLRELGLVKQADLLGAVAARVDPAEKLDDFVKLHQVLGIALARLAGAVAVDRATLEAVPGFPSVLVRREAPAAPGGGGPRPNRYQLAAAHARRYATMTVEELAASVYPAWADGSATPHIVRALAREPAVAVAAARRVLGLERGASEKDAVRAQMRRARAARLTAVQVLAAAGTPEARDLLAACTRGKSSDAALAAHARRALATLSGEVAPASERKEMEELVRAALHGAQKEERAAALHTLGTRAFVDAIPAMRASFARDVSGDVREAAAYALATMGDVESVDAFVALLSRRDEPGAGRFAKIGAHVLGVLGDVRGIDELLRAYAEGWQPGIVADAIRAIGPAALEPLLDLLVARPEIAERKAALGVVASLPADEVAVFLGQRIDDAAGLPGPQFCARAGVYLAVAATHKEVGKQLARRILELRPVLLDKKAATTDEKLLARKCAKHGG